MGNRNKKQAGVRRFTPDSAGQGLEQKRQELLHSIPLLCLPLSDAARELLR